MLVMNNSELIFECAYQITTDGKVTELFLPNWVTGTNIPKYSCDSITQQVTFEISGHVLRFTVFEDIEVSFAWTENAIAFLFSSDKENLTFYEYGRSKDKWKYGYINPEQFSLHIMDKDAFCMDDSKLIMGFEQCTVTYFPSSAIYLFRYLKDNPTGVMLQRGVLGIGSGSIYPFLRTIDPFRAGINDRDLLTKVYSEPYFRPLGEEESIRLLEDERNFMTEEYLAELRQMLEQFKSKAESEDSSFVGDDYETEKDNTVSQGVTTKELDEFLEKCKKSKSKRSPKNIYMALDRRIDDLPFYLFTMVPMLIVFLIFSLVMVFNSL